MPLYALVSSIMRCRGEGTRARAEYKTITFATLWADFNVHLLESCVPVPSAKETEEK